MVILHITFSLRNGGKENLLIDIANRQSYLGHSVTILIINAAVDRELIRRASDDVEVLQLGRRQKSRNLFSLLKLIAVIRLKVRPDIIHSHDVGIGNVLRRGVRRPSVLTVHGPGVPVSGMRRYNVTFAISKAVKKDVEGRGGPACKVIYNGIDTTLIKARQPVVPRGRFRLVQVKRLNHERKGQDLLIRAAARLVRVHGFENIQVFFIGEGDSESYLRALVEELSIDDHVSFLGAWSREKVYEGLCDFDLFVHPSRYEGFGLTVAEAMVAKVPVVASNIQGPVEILGEGMYGHLFESGSVESLVQAVTSCWRRYEDGTIFERLERACDHSVKQFDIVETARRYTENYPIGT